MEKIRTTMAVIVMIAIEAVRLSGALDSRYMKPRGSMACMARLVR